MKRTIPKVRSLKDRDDLLEEVGEVIVVKEGRDYREKLCPRCGGSVIVVHGRCADCGWQEEHCSSCNAYLVNGRCVECGR